MNVGRIESKRFRPIEIRAFRFPNSQLSFSYHLYVSRWRLCVALHVQPCTAIIQPPMHRCRTHKCSSGPVVIHNHHLGKTQKKWSVNMHNTIAEVIFLIYITTIVILIEFLFLIILLSQLKNFPPKHN